MILCLTRRAAPFLLLITSSVFSADYRCEFKLSLVERMALQEYQGINNCRKGELLNEIIYDQTWDRTPGDGTCLNNLDRNTTSVLHAKLIDQEPVIFEFNDLEKGAKIISGGTEYNGHISAKFILKDHALSHMPVKSFVEVGISVFPTYLDDGTYNVSVSVDKHVYAGKLPDGSDSFVSTDFWYESMQQQGGGDFYQGYNSLFPVNMHPRHPLDYLMSPTGLADSKFHSDMAFLWCKRI